MHLPATAACRLADIGRMKNAAHDQTALRPIAAESTLGTNMAQLLALTPDGTDAASLSKRYVDSYGTELQYEGKFKDFLRRLEMSNVLRLEWRGTVRVYVHVCAYAPPPTRHRRAPPRHRCRACTHST